MQINCHAHLFNLRVLNTRRTRETLVNRLTKEKWPAYLVKILLKAFDEALKDDILDEEKLLRKLVGALKLSEEFKSAIDSAFDVLPWEVGLVLHGDLDGIAVSALRSAVRKLSDGLSHGDDIGQGDIEDVIGFLILGLQPTMEDVGRASKKRIERRGHWVSCLGVRSQRANESSARYGRVGDYRTFRCSRRSGCGPGRACQSYGDRPVPV